MDPEFPSCWVRQPSPTIQKKASALPSISRIAKRQRRKFALMSNAIACWLKPRQRLFGTPPLRGEFTVEQPSWTEFTGQSFEELRGWGWLNAIHPEDRIHTERIWSEAVAKRNIYEVEHRLRTKNNAYHNMMVRAVPILDSEGAIRQWIGIHTDITERKKAEERILEQACAAG